jgi:flagellar protein FlaG
MEAKVREVQTVMVDSWVRQDHGSATTESPVIRPAVKPETKQGAKGFGQDKRSQQGNAVQGDTGKTKKLVEEVQSYLDNMNIQLSFDIHDKTGDMVVQVLERESGDLIRQIPPDDLLDLRDKLDELRGVLFHQKA